MPLVADSVTLSSNASLRVLACDANFIATPVVAYGNLLGSKGRGRSRQRHYSSVSRSRKNSQCFLLNSPFPEAVSHEDPSRSEGDAERIGDATVPREMPNKRKS